MTISTISRSLALAATATLATLLSGCATTGGNAKPTPSIERFVDLKTLKGDDVQSVTLGLAFGPAATQKEKSLLATGYLPGGYAKVDTMKRLGRSSDEIMATMAARYDAELAPKIAAWKGTGFTFAFTGYADLSPNIPKIYRDGKIVFNYETDLLEYAGYLKEQNLPFEYWTKDERQSLALFPKFMVTERVLYRPAAGLDLFGPQIPVRSTVKSSVALDYPRDKLEELVLKGRTIRVTFKFEGKVYPELDNEVPSRPDYVLRLKLLEAKPTLLEVKSL